jgi:hypothetical protein
MQINHGMRPCFFQLVVACRKPPIDEASLGSEIVLLEPMIPPTSIVHIDTQKRSISLLKDWKHEFQRPIYCMRQSKPTVDKCGCLAAQGAGVSSAMRCSGVFASPGRMSAR